MNKDRLRDICHKIAKETGLTYNSIQTYYFLESILSRIAESEVRDNFIFKGGFLLSNIIGLNQRSTVDIDLLVNKMKLI